MTLAALFWMTHAGSALSDLKRIYLVARRKLTLKELLNAFGDSDPRALKQFLRQDPAITSCDDRFSEYRECYRRLLHMDNPNAPALLARALGLKKIDDLTTLIRNLVLEPSNVRDDTRKAVNEFTDLVGIHNQLVDARQQLDEVSKRNRQWEKLAEYRWRDIDVPFWKTRIEQFQSDIQQLEQAGGDLAVAKSRWEAAKEALQKLQVDKEQQNIQLGGLTTQLYSAENNRQRASKLAEQGLADEQRTQLQKKIGLLKDSQLEDASKIEAQHRERFVKQRDVVYGRKNRTGHKAVGIMTGFRTKWEVIATDWSTDLASLPDCLRHLAQLEDEGLPALVEKFRERLNRHTTQSLARIRSRIESEREDIYERIETINRVLQRTEFRVGSYLRLGIKNDQYEHVMYFKRSMDQVMEQLTSDDHEARFVGLQMVIEILERASNPATANNLESLRLLDPRHQLSFYAEEFDTKDGSIRDVLLSSSGKSGGEKESFAGTIVAASLAYVLTPDGLDRPVYSTVFLDEAFSNTAEAVSRHVLRIFKELHLHINLITPYKNLNLARESAHSLLITDLLDILHDDAISLQGGLLRWLNCRSTPSGWLLIRPLCQQSREQLAQLSLLQMDTQTLQHKPLPASNILIVENKQSGYTLPELVDTIAVFGGGRNTASMQSEWLTQKNIGYWGDIDSWGLAILSEARKRQPQLQTLMMDESTLLHHQVRMVDEDQLYTRLPDHLTETEQQLFHRLAKRHYGKTRLEQERLAPDFVSQRLKQWHQTSAFTEPSKPIQPV